MAYPGLLAPLCEPALLIPDRGWDGGKLPGKTVELAARGNLLGNLTLRTNVPYYLRFFPASRGASGALGLLVTHFGCFRVPRAAVVLATRGGAGAGRGESGPRDLGSGKWVKRREPRGGRRRSGTGDGLGWCRGCGAGRRATTRRASRVHRHPKLFSSGNPVSADLPRPPARGLWPPQS